MQVRLHGLIFLALLVLSACSDSPVEPEPSAENAVASRSGAWIPGDPGECDPYLDANWCKDSGICEMSGPTPPDDSLSVQSCPGGGTGGGGTAPPAPPAPDTCKTSNPLVDDPAVQAGFKDLWTRSRISEPQAQRLETVAWIIRSPDGTLSLANFEYTERGPCGANGNWYPPPGAIAVVHTHPFAAREEMVVCGPLKRPLPNGGWADIVRPDGRPVYQRYSNQPSWPDRDLINNVINRIRRAEGKEPLDAYVIDHERITRYGFNGLKDVPYNRCGY
jgi:hypothetical protein